MRAKTILALGVFIFYLAFFSGYTFAEYETSETQEGRYALVIVNKEAVYTRTLQKRLPAIILDSYLGIVWRCPDVQDEKPLWIKTDLGKNSDKQRTRKKYVINIPIYTGDTLKIPAIVLDIEESTVRMNFGVNTSPFAGLEGEFKTARQIRDRLFKAAEADVALKVEDGPSGDLLVSGRGELHLAILIERLRREGYEFQVGKPQVIEKVINGKLMTPYEKVAIEVPESMSGTVMQKMGYRHAELLDMNTENNTTFLLFVVATKEFFGYRSQFVTDTKGLGILSSSFLEYRPDPGNKLERQNGSLVVFEPGITKLYALVGAQDRGTLFIEPGTEVYKGQVIGQNSRGDDIEINVCKEKKQTNHRSSGEGTSEHFNTPKIMSLENAIEYIDDSELVEVTPKNIRIRKIDLNR